MMKQLTEDQIACLKLVRWHGVSGLKKAKIVQSQKSFQKLLDFTISEWEKLSKWPLKTKNLPHQCCIEKDEAWLSQQGHYLITLFDKEYPSSLLELEDPPLALFAKGNIDVLNHPQVAIVGSRQQTPTGKQIARDFSQRLCNMGLSITSGLAKGIDSSAHSAVCEMKGHAIAVLGCGLDIIYPRQNQNLAMSIEEYGCLISEFPIGTPPKRENFPARNRVIAALSEGVLVVEAAIRSGSLITARLAAELGKEVFAIPGSIFSQQSKGCHLLIKQGAVLTQSADDILLELELPLLNRLKQSDCSDSSKQTKIDCRVLDSIDHHAISFEQIVMRTNIDFHSLSQRLIELELDGLVARAHNGDYYRLV